MSKTGNEIYDGFLEKIGVDWIVPTNAHMFAGWGEHTLCDQLHQLGFMERRFIHGKYWEFRVKPSKTPIQTTLNWQNPDHEEPLEMQEIFVAYRIRGKLFIDKAIHSEGIALIGGEVMYLSHCLLWASCGDLKVQLLKSGNV
jgi:hypothetical protein